MYKTFSAEILKSFNNDYYAKVYQDSFFDFPKQQIGIIQTVGIGKSDLVQDWRFFDMEEIQNSKMKTVGVEHTYRNFSTHLSLEEMIKLTVDWLPENIQSINTGNYYVVVQLKNGIIKFLNKPSVEEKIILSESPKKLTFSECSTIEKCIKESNIFWYPDNHIISYSRKPFSKLKEF